MMAAFHSSIWTGLLHNPSLCRYICMAWSSRNGVFVMRDSGSPLHGLDYLDCCRKTKGIRRSGRRNQGKAGFLASTTTHRNDRRTGAPGSCRSKSRRRAGIRLAGLALPLSLLLTGTTSAEDYRAYMQPGWVAFERSNSETAKVYRRYATHPGPNQSLQNVMMFHCRNTPTLWDYFTIVVPFDYAVDPGRAMIGVTIFRSDFL